MFGKSKAESPHKDRDRRRTLRRALPRDNSAVNRDVLSRDPRAEMMAMAAAEGGLKKSPPRPGGELPCVHENGSANNGGAAGRGRKPPRPAERRRSLVDMQANSAVNRTSLARDPRHEMGVGNMDDNVRSNSLGREREQSHSHPSDEETDRAGDNDDEQQHTHTPHRRLGRVRHTLFSGSKTGKNLKKPAYPPEEKKEDRRKEDRRMSENSAIDRKALVKDPREERESFMRRRSQDDEDQMSFERRRSRDRDADGNTPSSHNESRASSQDDDEYSMPSTRPSEPTRRPRNRCRFDVHETRASLMTRLQDDASTKNLKCAPKGEDFRSSLTDCLGDMGFDMDQVAMAIESTNANSSQDAAKVVEWLGEHSEELEEVKGGSKSRSFESTGYSSHDDETQYTKCTQASRQTQASYTTTETEESDENMQMLKDSLKDLGFSRADIKKSKEMYRRHSDNINAQEFISAMLEVESDVGDSARSGSSKENKHEARSGSSKENKHKAPQDNGSLRSDMIKSISEMGFEKDHIADAIDDMEESGTKNIDVEKVLSVLLSGGGNTSSRAERYSNKRSMSDGFIRTSSHGSKSDASANQNGRRGGRNRTTVATSRPQQRLDDKDVLGSIEITPGHFAKLLKGRQTWNAMHAGTAVSEACIICATVLRCCPEADYVLCPDCNVVSPLSSTGRRTTGKEVGAVGLGYRKES